MNKYNNDFWIGVILFVTPFIYIGTLLATFTNAPDFWLKTIFFAQPLIMISLSIGIGKIACQWGVRKNRSWPTKYAKPASYIATVIISLYFIVPQSMQIAREEISKLNPLTQEKIAPILVDHYSGIYKSPIITSISTILPKDKDWIVSFELCEDSKSNKRCLPLKAVINSDNKVTYSDIDVSKLRQSIQAQIDKDPAAQAK